MEKIEWYELVKKEWEVHPEQFVTAAMWMCSMCGEAISGHSGPGNGTLCVKCGDDIKSGKLKYNRGDDKNE